MKPTEGLNMDLNIIQAADMETDMGRVNIVSYTALSLLLFWESKAKVRVITSVIGTLKMAIISVCFSAGRKSLREYV